MPARRRIIVIVNGSAGSAGGAEAAAQLQAALRAIGAQPARTASNGGELVELARAAAREQPDVLVAAGGDGTANAVASVLVDTEVALGVLPLGTLNHFAKALRMPLDVGAAATAIAAGTIRRVDVGAINGRIFLNNASLGLYPRLVRLRQKQQQQLGRGKWSAAAWAALSVLRRGAVMRVRLTLDGEQVSRRTALIFIGNNAYEMNGLRIGERMRLDGGHLGVYLPRRSGRSGLPLLAIRALFGRLREAEHFDVVLARAVEIETRHSRLLVAVDGEVFVEDAPLQFRIRPGALRVVVGDFDPAAG